LIAPRVAADPRAASLCSMLPIALCRRRPTPELKELTATWFANSAFGARYAPHFPRIP